MCHRFQISRKTGYKRINRFRECGDEGLGDLSRAPRRHPNATSSVVARQLIEVKQAHPTWGPKKVVAWLRAQVPQLCWPASSTAGEILNRAGLVKRRHRRRRTSPWSQPFTEAIDANDVWCMDFKGWFRTGDHAHRPSDGPGCGVPVPPGMQWSDSTYGATGAPSAPASV